MKKLIIAFCAVGALSACSSVPSVFGQKEETAPVVEKAPEKAPEETNKVSAVTPEQTMAWVQASASANDVYWGLKHGMKDAGFKVDEEDEGKSLIGTTTLTDRYGEAQFAARTAADGANVKVVMAVTKTTDENAKLLMEKVRKGLDEYLTVKKKYKLPK